jgi:hypothetical protein
MIYYVTNVERRISVQNRYITYDLKEPLPNEWDELSIDDKGTWLNNNAIFVRDEFEDLDADNEIDEETVDISTDIH